MVKRCFEAMKLLGHATATTTANLYAHQMAKARAKAGGEQLPVKHRTIGQKSNDLQKFGIFGFSKMAKMQLTPRVLWKMFKK